MFPGQRITVELFYIHAQSGREFAMHNKNITSIVCDPSLLETASSH